MAVAELTDLTVSEAAELLWRRDVSAPELLQATLRQIEATEPVYHAYATVMREVAEQAAASAQRELDSGYCRGPLHGVPVGVKDLLHTTDAPTEAGSKVLAGFVPAEDASVVTRLRDAGAVIVGKTVTHEFAYGQDVPATRNAWNASCYPGGSSAGSAVSVALRSAYAAIGTDTGGSIRVPATVNGVVGLKPTFGRVSRRGVIAMSPSLDHVGPITRTVKDAALVLQAIAGFDPRDPSSLDCPVDDYPSELEQPIDGIRIGVDREYAFYEHVTDDVRDGVTTALSDLEQQGATLVDVRIPAFELMPTVGLVTLLADTSTYHRRYLRDKAAAYHPNVRVMLETGNLVFASDYLVAQRARRMLRDEVRRVFEDNHLHALASPTLPSTTVPLDELSVALKSDSSQSTLSTFVHHTFPANVLGQPALSVPCGFSSQRLPIGLELLGAPLDEATLFRIGHAYEREHDWHRRHPLTAGVTAGD
jgi:aspartyl-tRNA(Asn)/glutamyl-tRNA(Gln) amidotransferase subunit A